MSYVSRSPECHRGQYLGNILNLFQWYAALTIATMRAMLTNDFDPYSSVIRASLERWD
jgi:hypothetical protein